MDTDALARDIDAACRLTGRFTLRSGLVATEYFDKYLFESDPVLLQRVATGMLRLLPDDAELLGGLELGGVPIATMLSSLTGIPALFVRKEAKSYGTCRLAEGASVEGRTVALVEDVITTGGAVRDAAVVRTPVTGCSPSARDPERSDVHRCGAGDGRGSHRGRVLADRCRWRVRG